MEGEKSINSPTSYEPLPKREGLPGVMDVEVPTVAMSAPPGATVAPPRVGAPHIVTVEAAAASEVTKEARPAPASFPLSSTDSQVAAEGGTAGEAPGNTGVLPPLKRQRTSMAEKRRATVGDGASIATRRPQRLRTPKEHKYNPGMPNAGSRAAEAREEAKRQAAERAAARLEAAASAMPKEGEFNIAYSRSTRRWEATLMMYGKPHKIGSFGNEADARHICVPSVAKILQDADGSKKKRARNGQLPNVRAHRAIHSNSCLVTRTPAHPSPSSSLSGWHHARSRSSPPAHQSYHSPVPFAATRERERSLLVAAPRSPLPSHRARLARRPARNARRHIANAPG